MLVLCFHLFVEFFFGSLFLLCSSQLSFSLSSFGISLLGLLDLARSHLVFGSYPLLGFVVVHHCLQLFCALLTCPVTLFLLLAFQLSFLLFQGFNLVLLDETGLLRSVWLYHLRSYKGLVFGWELVKYLTSKRVWSQPCVALSVIHELVLLRLDFSLLFLLYGFDHPRDAWESGVLPLGLDGQV